ncbi:MAG: beta-ketoacyl-ACP synthase II [Candidatus Marinimicrobia bacterium]|nr:beta-ketoacyl-ACP synthase II [Candidatus Neomarinimicrobiota bacterium]MCH7938291.1 beta-ketoacyl-ACP synthase II [Candidatus Neomarinimicrobiota bacterium]
MRRIVVTGMGAVTPIGNTVAEYEDGLYSGRNGIGPITHFDTSEFTCRLAGEIKGLDPTTVVDRKDMTRMDQFTVLAMVAADEALAQSRLLENVDLDRVGVIIGTGTGGMGTFEEQHARLLKGGPRRVSPFFVPMLISDIAAGQVSIRYGLKGPNYCVISACATASTAIGDAFRMLLYGDADAIVAGGTEASILPMAIAGFANMRALSRNPDPATACRPFDSERDGFVMGEGAGMLILEELEHALRREAPILAELVGYGATADAFHITAPAEGGEGAVRAMRIAIKDGNAQPEEVGYINAHGTSTQANDKNETQAIKTVFGAHAQDLIVSSTKSMTGHLLGAAGAIEAIACIFALRRQEIPPTINFQTPDPECDLNYSPNTATKHTFEYALSNTFGFGGHNAVLLMRRYDHS